MRALGTILALLALVAVSACQNRKSDAVAFDGQYFRSKASKVDGDRAQIRIAVRPATASVAGALEAGRYEATRYCIENYGTSAVDWVVGPDQDPEEVVLQGDELILRGACQQ